MVPGHTYQSAKYTHVHISTVCCIYTHLHQSALGIMTAQQQQVEHNKQKQEQAGREGGTM